MHNKTWNEIIPSNGKENKPGAVAQYKHVGERHRWVGTIFTLVSSKLVTTVSPLSLTVRKINWMENMKLWETSKWTEREREKRGERE